MSQDQKIVKDERGQEQPADKKRAQQNTAVEGGAAYAPNNQEWDGPAAHRRQGARPHREGQTPSQPDGKGVVRKTAARTHRTDLARLKDGATRSQERRSTFSFDQVRLRGRLL